MENQIIREKEEKEDSEETFNQLKEIQQLIRKESSLKGLCN